MNPTSGAVCVARTCEAEAPPLGVKPLLRTRCPEFASKASAHARKAALRHTHATPPETPPPLASSRHCACAALSFASTPSAHAQRRHCVITMRRLPPNPAPLASSPVCACAALTLQPGAPAAAWRKNLGTAASLANRLHPLLYEWNR